MDPLLYACVSCGAEVSLDVVLARVLEDLETRGLVEDVLAEGVPVGAQLARYVRLHKPLKQQLTIARVRKILAELVPDIRRATVERGGRMVVATPAHWQGAFEAVFTAVERGSLALPLTSNAYLYSVVMRQAEATAAAAERQREEDRRRGAHRDGHRDTVTVSGQPMEIGAALGVVYGGVDPALAKIEADALQAAPMPDSVRAFRERIRGSAPAQSSADADCSRAKETPASEPSSSYSGTDSGSSSSSNATSDSGADSASSSTSYGSDA
ncbi:hypothetical protein [Variovorax sp.]|uniref:hypothetical protein n=1 Tax=Variovorax sp. TaxID=1871043 RepID=UPI003BAA2CA9